MPDNREVTDERDLRNWKGAAVKEKARTEGVVQFGIFVRGRPNDLVMESKDDFVKQWQAAVKNALDWSTKVLGIERKEVLEYKINPWHEIIVFNGLEESCVAVILQDVQGVARIS